MDHKELAKELLRGLKKRGPSINDSEFYKTTEMSLEDIEKLSQNEGSEGGMLILALIHDKFKSIFPKFQLCDEVLQAKKRGELNILNENKLGVLKNLVKKSKSSPSTFTEADKEQYDSLRDAIPENVAIYNLFLEHYGETYKFFSSVGDKFLHYSYKDEVYSSHPKFKEVYIEIKNLWHTLYRIGERIDMESGEIRDVFANITSIKKAMGDTQYLITGWSFLTPDANKLVLRRGASSTADSCIVIPSGEVSTKIRIHRGRPPKVNKKI